MTELTAMSAMTTTPTPVLIDRELLDAVGSEAKGSPRRRKNHNFHAEDAAIDVYKRQRMACASSARTSMLPNTASRRSIAAPFVTASERSRAPANRRSTPS